MATDDEIIKLILQIQGQQEAKRAAEEVGKLQKQVLAMGSTMAATDPQMLALGRRLDDTRTKAVALEKQFGLAGGGSRNMGAAILEGSRALEDLQYGIAGVLNNIPGLVQMLGGGAGMAGAISAVAVGATILYKNWDSILGLFGETAEKIDPSKTAVENLTDRVNKLKEAIKDASGTPLEIAVKRIQLKSAELDLSQSTTAQSAFDKQQASQTPGEAEAAQMTAKALAGSDAGNVLKQVEMDKLLAKDAGYLDAKKRLEDYKNRPDFDRTGKPGAQRERAELIRKLESEIQVARSKVISGAEEQAGTLLSGDPKTLQDALIAAGRDDLARKVKTGREMGPGKDALESTLRFGENEEAEMLNAQGALYQTLGEQAAALIKKNNDEAEQLTKDGLENQRLAFKAMEEDAARLMNRNIAVAARAQGERQGGDMARAGGLVGRIADASGLADPATMQLFNARQAGMAKLTDANNIRKWRNMTQEEREQAIGNVNDKADKQTEEQAFRQIMRSGLTRSPVEARAAAAQLVNQARGNVNGATGDPMTVAAEKNAKTSEQLLAAVVDLKRGIPVIMGP